MTVEEYVTEYCTQPSESSESNNDATWGEAFSNVEDEFNQFKNIVPPKELETYHTYRGLDDASMH